MAASYYNWGYRQIVINLEKCGVEPWILDFLRVRLLSLKKNMRLAMIVGQSTNCPLRYWGLKMYRVIPVTWRRIRPDYELLNQSRGTMKINAVMREDLFQVLRGHTRVHSLRIPLFRGNNNSYRRQLPGPGLNETRS
ncbi:unnamed protein product, partial [Mesorhabditis belari]|uniref:Uncharacterized protein n=1 Tax=Mesorhabditis belari TaxID=2138241 RepID=A0AAF3FTC8_9BILA